MALMAYYCETHRWAWPIADGGDPKGNCPAAGAGSGASCKVQSVDTISQIRDLGLELAAIEEAEEG